MFRNTSAPSPSPFWNDFPSVRGDGTDGEFVNGYIVEYVPEPNSALMLGVGWAGAIVLRRRKG